MTWMGLAVRTNGSRAEVMSRFVVALMVVLLGCLMFTGCTGSDESAVESESRPEPEPLDEEAAAAARSRGVVEERSNDTDAKPQVVLGGMTYEWRTVPERGLQVALDFTNPAGSYERARGYVFLIAKSTNSGSLITGIYPWNTVMDGALPEDYTDGTHLLYRDRQLVRGFIPYPASDGYYETLTLYVFHEDGRLLTNRTYDVEISGVPGASRTVNPGFDL